MRYFFCSFLLHESNSIRKVYICETDAKKCLQEQFSEFYIMTCHIVKNLTLTLSAHENTIQLRLKRRKMVLFSHSMMFSF